MKGIKYPRLVKSVFLILVLICCLIFKATAQTAPATTATAAATPKPAVSKGAAAIIDKFFTTYKDDGTAAAIDYIFGTNKYFTNNSAIALMKAKLDSLRQTVGPYIGKELILQKSASSSLIFYSYLVKNEIQPIRFTFTFYKPQNDWVLYRFKYDDQMDAELEEAGKINNKRP